MKSLICTSASIIITCSILWMHKVSYAPLYSVPTLRDLRINANSASVPLETLNLVSDFGAVPNNKAVYNDLAFQKAAIYINRRHGHVILFIPSGIYWVKNQTGGKALLEFSNDTNVIITGKQPHIKYIDSLYYGAFNPADLKPYNSKDPVFANPAYAFFPGGVITLNSCNDIHIENLDLDGNNSGMKVGGRYGDYGIQLPHVGIKIWNSRNISLSNLHTHHFGQDGVEVLNHVTKVPDSIYLNNVNSEFNGRQGLSWVRGNSLNATNCKFNHTAKARIASAPGAGLDIEAEDETVSGGRFYHCEFVDNSGCGMVADSGPSSDCTFDHCLFWGTNTWSSWTVKPAFKFYDCKFFGSIVHMTSASTRYEGTLFKRCLFQDSSYEGKQAYGKYLFEVNTARNGVVDSCVFVCHGTKRLIWIEAFGNTSDADRCIISNCKFYAFNKRPDPEQFLGVMRLVIMKNNVVHSTAPIIGGFHTELSIGEQPKWIYDLK